MTLNIQIPQKLNIKPTITVFGVGGAGGNAVNNMISSGLEGANFVVANTDAQSLDNSLTEHRIQLGETITQGLGAGSYPEVGKASAEETSEAIIDALSDSNMVFITAGMGGGTGTGAAPVIARLAREQGVLTVAVVTKPFHFEGSHRMRVAELGLQELQKYVDTLVVIPNQNLFRVADKNTTFADAFQMADEVLNSGIKGVTDLMVMPGLINLDFADIRSVMSEMGKAMMGTGEAAGENRAAEAADAAIANPLLDNVSMKGAKGVLISITGGPDLTLFEVDEAANRIREEVEQDANIIFGSTFDDTLEGKIRVSIVATGIDLSTEGNVTSLFSEDTNAVSEFSIGEESENSVGESEVAEVQGTDGDNFISPEPASVELDENVSEESDIDKNSGLTVSEKPFAEPKTKSRGLGIFGRFAASVEEAAAAPAPEPAKEEVSEQTSQEPVSEETSLEVEEGARTEISEVKEPQTDDFLDIPAFLRRKSG